MAVTRVSLLLLLVLTVLLTVQGLYVVQVRMNSYSNPTNKCSTCLADYAGTYGCCDTWSNGECSGSQRCDHYFRYCLRPLGSSVNSFNNCPSNHPRVTSQYVHDGEEIDFSRSRVLQVDNPLILHGLTSTWTGVQLFVGVIDWDGDMHNGDDPIDAVAININVQNTVLGVESARIVYSGTFGLSHIGLQYEVRCAEHYIGDNCETLDPCLMIDCGANGHCQNGDGSYTCVCNPGYTGQNCDVDIDDCAGVDCSGNGHCMDAGIDSYSCDCFAGFTGSLCDRNIDDCIGVDCNGHGQCQDGVNSFTCACSLDFTGELCEIEINVNNCIGINCNGNGQCEDGVDSFTCLCDTGFTGTLCQTNIDDCARMNCNGNGQCEDGVDSFTCLCDTGFTGTLCETNIDDCPGVNCNGNGQCEDGVDSFMCVCDSGFTGPQCETQSDISEPVTESVIDDALGICTSINCQNNGLCVNNGTDMFLCICDTGFTGQLCETNIDDCASVDCSGNGRCVDGANEHGCICFSGYYGDHCENHPNMNSNGSGTAQNTQGDDPSGMIIILGAIGGTVLLVFTFTVVVMVILCVYARTKSMAKHSQQAIPPKGIDCACTENPGHDIELMEMSRNVGYGVVGIYGAGGGDPTRVGSRRDPIIYDEADQVLDLFL